MKALALAPFPAQAPDASVVRRVLGWMRQQPSEARARAISALARAYLSTALPAGARADALVAMTAALDDTALAVRRALAEALASAADAPRHIVAALAGDRAEVACPVLRHSPLLEDSLLAELARHGGLSEQIAIARRARLGARAAWAIADAGGRHAARALIENRRATLDAPTLRRLHDRFAADGAVREALGARGGLPAALRVDLAVASAVALTDFGLAHAWMEAGRAERLLRDSREQAIVQVARDCDPEELPALVDHLRTQGYLTVAVLMRALLSGDVSLFETALASTSGAPARRVAGFLADWRGRGFAAIYAKSGLPEAFLPAFRAALGALGAGLAFTGEGVSQALALRAIETCQSLGDERLEPVLSLMWRLAGEGARDEAQTTAQDFVALEAHAAPAEPAAIYAAPAPIDYSPPLRIDFDPLPGLALELDLAVAELLETGAFDEAPRLDFVASRAGEGDAEAPTLPAPLDFEGVNENDAPPVAIDVPLGAEERVAVAA